jgi:GNAT superfamily N-acetyltransferase
MTFHIRPATAADSNAIARVQVESWRTTYRGIVPDDFLANLSIEQREPRWRDILANASSQGSFAYLAEDSAGQAAGFATGGPERENDPAYPGELYALYLLETYQRKGLGRQLAALTAREHIRRGFNAMLVWVLADNPSRKFYERLGGRRLREKEITIGTVTLVEVAYGWPDLRPLAETPPPPL